MMNAAGLVIVPSGSLALARTGSNAVLKASICLMNDACCLAIWGEVSLFPGAYALLKRVRL